MADEPGRASEPPTATAGVLEGVGRTAEPAGRPGDEITAVPLGD